MEAVPKPAPVHHAFGAGGVALAMLVNVLFALNMIAMKVVVDASAPLTAVSLRMASVFLLCLPFFRVVRGKSGWLALYGIVNGGLFPLTLNLALMMATNVGALAIAGQLGVPFSLLLGALLLHDRLSPVRMAGVAIAFAGVVLLVFDPAIAREFLAVVVMTCAACLWGGGALIQRKLGGVTVMNGQAWNGLMGAAVLLPFALLFESGHMASLPHAGAQVIGWFAFSVIGSVIIGQGMLAWLLQRHLLSTIMPLMLASPVMATIFASLYFGTPITPIMIVGGLIALGGVAIIVLVPQEARPPAR